jgi:hypothetical protein
VTTYWLACSNLIGVALSKKGNCQLGPCFRRNVRSGAEDERQQEASWQTRERGFQFESLAAANEEA